jgi:REP element-mobilizing transposase RayT
MPRTLRHQYPGAFYQLMGRGDGGKEIFTGDDDRKAFLFRLGKVCGSHGWRVHAWVLMGNHFHLLLETPEPNLVTGMKYLLGTFSQGWNARRSRRGHIFQGRYKSVPVSAAVDSPHYFRITSASRRITSNSIRPGRDWPAETGENSFPTNGAVSRVRAFVKSPCVYMKFCGRMPQERAGAICSSHD